MTPASAMPRSILIIRLSAIGDVVMASPLIGALRRTYPNARLAWLVQSEARDLLSANTQLDEVIVWPRNAWRELLRNGRWLTLLREVKRFIEQLRAQRFDVALDLQGLLKSGVWAWLCGAPARIGLGSKEGSARLMTRVVAKPQGDKHIGSEYRHLAEALALDMNDFSMTVALSAEDRDFAQRLRTDHALTTGYVIFCPFTTRPQKHWFEDHWLQLAESLHARYGWRCLILGGPGEAAAGANLAQRAPHALLNFAGATRLRQAAALIEQAKLVVGVDTGLVHMGTAFRVPTLALFGSTCPYLDAGTPTTRVMYHALPCSPCRRHPTCGGAFTCMRELTAARVMAQAQSLLQ